MTDAKINRIKLRGSQKGNLPLAIKTIEELALIKSPARRSGKVKDIALRSAAIFLLCGVVAGVGHYMAQSAVATTSDNINLANVDAKQDFGAPALTLISRKEFVEPKFDYEENGFSSEVSQQVTAALKGDLQIITNRSGKTDLGGGIDNSITEGLSLRTVALDSKARGLKPTVLPPITGEISLAALPEVEDADRPAIATPAVSKLQDIWKRGRVLKAEVRAARRYQKVVGPQRLQASNDAYCLAKAIYFEARSESKAGQLAVANVIMNRVKSKHYPNSICGVVYENRSNKRHTSCQFSFTCDGKHDRPRKGKQWNKSKQIAQKVLSGAKGSRVVNSSVLHYHADYVQPRWAKYMRRLTKIGSHIFYIGS